MSDPISLTAAEMAYVRRFVYEALYKFEAPGSTDIQRIPPNSSAYYDISALSTPSIQLDVIDDISGCMDPAVKANNYPKAAFPWASLDELHARADAWRIEHDIEHIR